MKTLWYTGFPLLLMLMFSSSTNGQSENRVLSGKVLFSIGKDEKPVVNESAIIFTPTGNKVIVHTVDEEGRIYLYENGKKRGPFNDISETGVKLPETDPEEYDPVFRKDSDTTYNKFSEYNDAGEVTLRFRGKTFGPYQFILEFYYTNNNTEFTAIVMKDGKPRIINSAGGIFDLDGQPGYSCISPTGRKIMVTTVKENNNAAEIARRDLTNMSPAEITKLGKEMEAKMKDMLPEAFICFQDGKKFGPYDPKKISTTNPAFIKSGGDNWILIIDSRLYINGIAVKDLYSEHLTPSNIWLTDDGKRYVIVVYNRIEFSDGTVYNDPLKIRFIIEKNRITLWWLSLENGKDIVLRSRTI